ncbi:MAG: hypothetical protein V2I25_06730 [Woeseiaceae bacterium]|jgi:pimeloyl-ACP methyl ester carboxylesterase|nr:hypothetical protein [Woeseiaceae bacterium]
MNALAKSSSRILRRHVESRPGLVYLVRRPKRPDPDKVLVAVHGISRQASYIIQALSEPADRFGYTLVAPIFDYRNYSDYQRLGRRGRGERADLALVSVVEDMADRLGTARDFHLFGFSGGAQFAHRFVYAWPGKAKSVILASAGWYTPPDPRVRFPYGTKKTRKLEALTFDGRHLADTPTLVVVGEADTRRDPALRQTDRVNSTQGRHRVARAKWFHGQLRRLAAGQPSPVEHEFALLPDAGHDFGEAIHQGGLAHKLFDFCERNHRPLREEISYEESA